MSAARASSLLRLSQANAMHLISPAARVSAGARLSSQRNLSIAMGRTSYRTPISAARQSLRATAPALLQRGYAASAALSHEEIKNRIFEVLKSFEKVDPAKVSPSSAFTTDLGLDSLDAVEVVMAIEEEFSIEIPDAEADNITSVQQAIEYIAKTPSAH